MQCNAHKICTSMDAPHLAGRESVIADFSQILTEQSSQEFRNLSSASFDQEKVRRN